MKNLPILLVMVLLTGLLATQPCLAQNQYGALAAGADGSVGWAADYSTQAGANARALAECGGHCTIKVEFWNTCAAYAQAGNGFQRLGLRPQPGGGRKSGDEILQTVRRYRLQRVGLGLHEPVTGPQSAPGIQVARRPALFRNAMA